METGRDAVDAVPAEGAAHVVQVPGRQLLRIVELVVVDQVAQPFDGATDLLRGRLRRVLGLVAARYEAGDHRAHRPDAEAGLHRSSPSFGVVPASTSLL